MKHILSDLEKALLTGAVTDLLELQNTPMPTGYGDGEFKIAIGDAREGYVRCNAGVWLGGVVESSAERMRISRAYVSLERRRLIDRVASRNFDRVTHIAPTESGLALVASLNTTLSEIATNASDSRPRESEAVEATTEPSDTRTRETAP